MAQPVTPSADAVIKPTVQIRIPPPKVRTREQMKAAAALEEVAPGPPDRHIPFRPTWVMPCIRLKKPMPPKIEFCSRSA